MFERASIVKPSDFNASVQVGRLLDSMLYYKSIDLVLTQETFPVFWRLLGAQGLKDLLNHPSLNVTLSAGSSSIVRRTLGSFQTYRWLYQINKGSNPSAYKKQSLAELYHVYVSQEHRVTVRDVELVIEGVQKAGTPPIIGHDAEIYSSLQSSFENRVTIASAFRAYATRDNQTINLDKLRSLKTEYVKYGEEFFIKSNIPIHDIAPKLDGWDLIIGILLDSALAVQYASINKADLVSDDEIWGIINSGFLGMNRDTLSNAKRGLSFEHSLFERRPVQNAFDNKAISLSECLSLIDRTAKFREWLHDIAPNQEILREYNRAIAKETWISKLPAKVGRYSAFTGAGALLDLLGTGGLSTVAGVAVSLFDAFVLDQIVGGWKPNHFVNIVERATGNV